MRIGYLGPPGTYSEEAASRRGKEWIKQGIQPSFHPYPSLPAVLEAVQRGKLEEGLLPVENSQEGSVAIAMDLLANGTEGITICGEVVLPITLHLMARHGTGLHKVTRVLSHPHALAECRKNLDRLLPGVDVLATVSTADAAQQVALSQEPWAALGTMRAAALYGLTIIVENVAGDCCNETRFLVMGREELVHSGEYYRGHFCEVPGSTINTISMKTSIIASTVNQPGALYLLLKEFAERGINLTRIESRPKKTRLGEYLFFIDMDGEHQDPRVEAALAAIRANTEVKVLGSYPAAG